MNLATFGKMILQLKKTFNEMGLVVRDVSSDGNCLFAAIVDQMRVRGDFRYTQENLRLAAVEYLKNNPTSVIALLLYMLCKTTGNITRIIEPQHGKNQQSDQVSQ